tara:strand:- start:1495 stop:2676 length:1182 start_codon:yes stop_codon:yes gene_type:complete
MPGPLDGIRILDFTRYQQGPFATVLLSDLGADVLKIEEPKNGDLGRSLGRQSDGFCAYFEAHNRNKRSLTVDLRTDEGREIILKLVPEFDVVTDNFRPDVMRRLGLGHDDLKAVNPKIITANASGFGSEGPRVAEPSFDCIGQAMGGMMIAQGGGPEEPPIQLVAGFADQVGAMIFALGICSAVVARERQGIGQHIDCSLLGTQLAMQSFPITGFLRNREQRSSPQRLSPTFTYYPCSDGLYLVLGILDPKWWAGFCTAINRDDLAMDERFNTPKARNVNNKELVSELDATFLQKKRSDWLSILNQADIPCGPVNDYEAMSREPQVLENKYITSLEHPSLGELDVVGTPIHLSETPAGPHTCAPELGQHTEEILLDIGYSWEDIESFKNTGII